MEAEWLFYTFRMLTCYFTSGHRVVRADIKLNDCFISEIQRSVCYLHGINLHQRDCSQLLQGDFALLLRERWCFFMDLMSYRYEQNQVPCFLEDILIRYLFLQLDISKDHIYIVQIYILFFITSCHPHTDRATICCKGTWECINEQGISQPQALHHTHDKDTGFDVNLSLPV